MGLRDAVIWLKRKIKGRKTEQAQQEEPIQEPEENRTPEGETEPLEPKTEAQEQEESALPEAEQTETCSASLDQALASFGISVEQAIEGTIKAIEIFAEALAIAFDIHNLDNLDRWQREKLKMSNNERRRRGLPMVRRQQHLRNLKNQRRKKKKTYERVKYKPGVYFREERTRL